MSKLIFAVDTGFAQTKWYLGNKQGSFPSAVASMPSLSTAGIAEDMKTYTIGGETFLVGLDALHPMCSQNYSRDIRWILAMAPFLVAKAADEARVNLADVEILSMGLPINKFRENKQSLIQSFDNVVINGVTINPKMKLTPQGVGALIAFSCETTVDTKRDRGVLIDIGGNTAIVIGHDKYKVTPAGSLQYDKKGITVAAEALASELREQYNFQPTMIEALVIMRDAEILAPNGKFVKITEQVDRILNKYANSLIKTIQNDFGEGFQRLNNIILAGGGAAPLANCVPKEWALKVRVLEDPEFANVRGYHQAAKEASEPLEVTHVQ